MLVRCLVAFCRVAMNKEQVGQMTQLDLSLFVSPETGQLDEQKLIDWVSKYRIGSLFNSPFAGHVGRCVCARKEILVPFLPPHTAVHFR